MSFLRIKLHYWPAVTCVWFILTFVTTFSISVLVNEHVYPYFPFISDTGSVPPESCIFGQMMNLGAVLMGIIVYIRHRQVNFAIKLEDLPLNQRWNSLASLSGFIACLGISVVANFQETAVLPMHLVGALMVFGNGAFYILVQTRITFAFRHIYRKNPDYWIGPSTLRLRIFVSIVYSFLYCIVVVSGFIGFLKFTGNTIIWWTEEHGGYQEHFAAAIAEWMLVFIFFTFLLSFTNEFKSLEYERVSFKSKNAGSMPTKEEMVQPKILFNVGPDYV